MNKEDNLIDLSKSDYFVVQVSLTKDIKSLKNNSKIQDLLNEIFMEIMYLEIKPLTGRNFKMKTKGKKRYIYNIYI